MNTLLIKRFQMTLTLLATFILQLAVIDVYCRKGGGGLSCFGNKSYLKNNLVFLYIYLKM